MEQMNLEFSPSEQAQIILHCAKTWFSGESSNAGKCGRKRGGPVAKCVD